jgi:hypothetical protein
MNGKIIIRSVGYNGNGYFVKFLAFWCDGYWPFIKVLLYVGGYKSEFIMISL